MRFGPLREFSSLIAVKLAETFPYLQNVVLGSGLAGSLLDYCYKTAQHMIAGGAAGLVVSFALTFYARRDPLLALAVALVFTFLVLVPLMLTAFILVPLFAYKSRGAKLSALFPTFLLYLGAYAAGGMRLTEAFEELRRIEELREFSVELDYVLGKVATGTPLHEALLRAATITPSPMLSRLFVSLSGGIRTGIPLSSILTPAYTQMIEEYRAETQHVVVSLGALFEAYLAVAVVTPIVLSSFGLLTLLVPAVVRFGAILSFITFILVPVTTVAALVVADYLASQVRIG